MWIVSEKLLISCVPGWLSIMGLSGSAGAEHLVRGAWRGVGSLLAASNQVWAWGWWSLAKFPLFFDFLHFPELSKHQSPLSIPFIFDRWHYDWAVVTPVKYENDTKDVNIYYTISNIPTENFLSSACLNIKMMFAGIGLPMLKRRWLQDHLIFNMGIPILVRQHLYIEMTLMAFMSPYWNQRFFSETVMF